ncbi:hypothetical protein DL95DRAFT_407995 [Leptodontidium sp. 2 PMI_412]|nr:hypothetical protein DL95DRAFT_407995 [Leptodontidium sp. 2 PMI_412]
MPDAQGKRRASCGKQRLKQIVRKIIQRFRDSKFNLIQRKIDSIQAYHDLRIRQVAGYLADPRRNTRWGTLIPQAIAEPALSRIEPAAKRPHSLRRQPGVENLRKARFVEVFSPTPSLLERSDPPPADFMPQHRLSISQSDRQEAVSTSKPLLVPDSIVQGHKLSYDVSDLQEALTASKPLTNAGEDALDDLYFKLTEHLREPADETESVLPGRMFPKPRRRPDSPYPGYCYPEPSYPERSQSRRAGGVFDGKGRASMVAARETLYRPVSDTSRTGQLFRIDSRGEFVSVEEEEAAEEYVEETATERKVRLGELGWI